MKKAILFLILGTVLVQMAQAVWLNESYNYRYNLTVRYQQTVNPDLVNNLLKVDVSSMQGDLPSLKVYDSSGNEHRWGWYLQTDFTGSTDYVHYNQTIVILSNFTNNTYEHLAIYVPENHTVDEAENLIAFMFDYEGTNHSLNNSIITPQAMNTSLVNDNSVDGSQALKVNFIYTNPDGVHFIMNSLPLDTPFNQLSRVCWYLKGGLILKFNHHSGYIMHLEYGTLATYIYHMYGGLDGSGTEQVKHYSLTAGGYVTWNRNITANEWSYTCAGDLDYSGDSFDGFVEGYLAYDNQPFRTTGGGTNNIFQFRFNGQPENQTVYFDRIWGTTDDDVQNFFKDPEILVISSADTFGIPEPAPPEVNVTLQPYNATHGITDVTGLVVDFGVEYGLQVIGLTGLIVIFTLGIYFVNNILGGKL